MRNNKHYNLFRLVITEGHNKKVVRIKKFNVNFKITTPSIDQRQQRKNFFESRIPLILIFEMNHSVNIGAYELTTGPFGIDDINRTPTKWKIYGSDNGLSWNYIDKVVDSNKTLNLHARKYTLNSKKTYKFYRFDFNKAFNSDIGRISTIKLYEVF